VKLYHATKLYILLPLATTVREAVPQANAQLEEYGKMCAEVLPKYIQVRYPLFLFNVMSFFYANILLHSFCIHVVSACIYVFTLFFMI